MSFNAYPTDALWYYLGELKTHGKVGKRVKDRRLSKLINFYSL